MSGIWGDTSHFLEWLSKVGIACDSNTHLPRRVYRRYLSYLRYEVIYKALHNGIYLSIVEDNVKSIIRGADSRFSLMYGNDQSSDYDLCFLCTGHNDPEDLYKLNETRGYFTNAYISPSPALSSGKSAAVIGSGLSAVDAALHLLNESRCSTVRCFSRSGFFPKIQPIDELPAPAAFKSAVVASIRSVNHVTAAHLVHTINNALYHYYEGPERLVSQQEEVYRSRSGIEDLQSNLHEALSSRRNIYTYLKGITEVVCDAWNKMQDSEKRIFFNNYLSSWMRNRHAMPLINAQKLNALAATGRISITSGIIRVEHSDDHFIIAAAERSWHAELVVNAIGPSYDARTSNLYQRLVGNGLARFNEFGGVDCDFADGRVISSHGNPQRDLIAVGPITKGTHFYVAAIDINLTRIEAALDGVFCQAIVRDFAEARATL